MRRVVVLLSSIIFLVPVGVSALSAQDQQSLYGNSIYYWPLQTTCSPGSVTTLSGSDNAEKIWNFFTSEGLTNNQAIGVMANLYSQSGFDPEIVQNPPGGDSQTPVSTYNVGWGLAQWTNTSMTPGTQNPVIGDAKTYNITTPIYELVSQLNLIWAEMTNQSPVGKNDMAKDLEQTTNAVQAAVDFYSEFEGGAAGAGPAEQAVTVLEEDYPNLANGSGGSTTTTNCGSNINCSSNDQENSSLSATRQDVVCTAQQQLSLWQSKPVSFRATGFLNYSQGYYEEWCADFVSWVFKQAGDPFTGGINGWGLPGVSSIEDQGSSNPNFQWHPVGDGYTPQPGDIAIFSGEHTAIVVSVSEGQPTLIGGDEGPSPDGVFGYPGGVASKTPYSPPSESTVNTGSLLQTEPSPNSLSGYVTPTN